MIDRVLVRHISRQRDFAERLLFVGAFHLIGAVLEHHVGFGGFEQVGGDLAALVDDLLQGIDDGRAADRQRA